MSRETLVRRLDRKKVPAAVLGVLERLRYAGNEAWLVGGGVRDLLRREVSRPPEDWDVATSARPKIVMGLFRKVIPTGLEHGTVTVLTRSGPVEVTTYRGEYGYTDARRPDRVEFLDEIEEDLARRDFTINAIAWDPLSAKLRDPFGGLRDLEAGVVRAVGDPKERFAEDGLRPMRAVRFACGLEFQIETATLEAIPGALGAFRKVAVERIRQELEKIIEAPRPSIGLHLMRVTGLIEDVFGPLADERASVWEARLSSLDAAPPRQAPRLALLLAHWPRLGSAFMDARSTLERLRFPKATVRRVEALLLASDWQCIDEAGSAGLRRILSRVGLELSDDVAALWRASARLFEESEQRAHHLASLLEREAGARPPLSAGDLEITGHEVMSTLGVGPGPVVGDAMAHLVDLVIEEPSLNDRERLREELLAWKAGRSKS